MFGKGLFVCAGKGAVLDEFSLIKTWFNCTALQPHAENIVLGNGDDCAMISIPEGHVLAQSIDTQVADLHFPASAPAALIGYRALAVSISDLAAMGATPHSFSLALTLPKADEVWLSELSRGMAALAQQCNITLIGGDTTRGPLTLSFHVQGFIDPVKALRRSGAKPGNRVFVSGHLGDAGGALPLVLKGSLPDKAQTYSERYLLNAYYYPQPQLALGRWLAEHGASAAIDISDGFLADLGHILSASGVGAEIAVDKLSLSDALVGLYGAEEARNMALTAGDDYQLCFCWPQDQLFPGDCPVKVTEIGMISHRKGIDTQGRTDDLKQGFKHF